MYKKVYIYPPNDTNNDFIISQSNAFSDCGITITNKLSEFRTIDLYVFNWYENIYNNQYLSFIKKIGFLFCLFLLKKTTVVYIHNIRPHKKYHQTPNYRLSNKLVRFMIRYCTKIAILTENAIDYLEPSIQKELLKNRNKISVIPHPNFTTLVKDNKPTPKVKGGLKIVAFGKIEAYKGIEILIEAMNRLQDTDVETWIIGQCESEMQAKLINASRNENTHFLFQFIENEELYHLFERFDVCVLPFDTFSCLNSSSALLAFSMKKTVICPHIATVDELPSDTCFLYTYDNKESHIETLCTTIKQVAAIKKENPNLLVEMGQTCFDYVLLNCSQEEVRAKTKLMLQKEGFSNFTNH
jgi:glycosyltransferase involved in cell wall biosynthesis